MFELHEERMFARARLWIAPAAGLLAAAFATFQLSNLPPVRPLAGAELLRLAAWYVVLPFFSCFVVYLLAAEAIRAGRRPWMRLAALRWSACAAWLGPLVVMVYRKSGHRDLILAVLALSLARQAQWYWQGMQGPVEPEPPIARGPFAVLEAAGWHRRFAGALLTAAMAQGALVAFLVEKPLAEVLLGGAAIVVLTWRVVGVAWRSSGWWAAGRKTGLTTILTFLIVALLLTPYLGHVQGAAANQLAAFVFQLFFRPRAPRLPPETARERGRYSPLGDDYPGVIVYPEMARHTILVPPPPVMARGVIGLRRDSPKSIPFFGVYWFIRFPQRRPPANSVTMTADPAKRGFFTLDHTPLRMEARQNLGIEVELTGCREVVVWIRNEEIYPVTMQLILVDTEGTSGPWSLGMEDVSPQTTGIRFALPRPRKLRRFDEFRVVIFPGARRQTRSSKLAIERFELRG